jgi:hypothetical protein
MNDQQITYAAIYGSIVFVFSLWVAFDAHAIGAHSGLVRGVANMGWFAWWLGTLVIFPIVFPLYLAKRPVIKIAAAAEGRGDIAKWRAVHPRVNRDTGELTEPVSEVYARTANIAGPDDLTAATSGSSQSQAAAFAPVAAAAAATSVVSQGFGQPAAVPTTGTVSVDPLLVAAQPEPDPSDLDLAVVGFPSFAAAQAAHPVSFETESQPLPEPDPEPEPVDFMTPLKMPEPLRVEPAPGADFDRTFDAAHSLGAAHLAEATRAPEPVRAYEPEPEFAAGPNGSHDVAHDFEPALAGGTTALIDKPTGESLSVPPLSIIPEAPKPLPPAGWYPDPANSAKLRYWDGKAWAAAQS